MVILKRALQRMKFVAVGKAFHRLERGAVSLHRKHETGTDRLPVEQNGAGTANSMFTAKMSAGEIQLLANEIGQGHSDFDEPLKSPPVDGDLDGLLAAQWRTPFADLASAASRARRAKTPPTSFLYSAEAWISESGSNSPVTAWASARKTPGSTRRPFKTDGAFSIRCGLPPTPNMTMAASFTFASSSSSLWSATPTSAKSPLRREISSMAQAAPGRQLGKRISVSNSRARSPSPYSRRKNPQP